MNIYSVVLEKPLKDTANDLQNLQRILSYTDMIEITSVDTMLYAFTNVSYFFPVVAEPITADILAQASFQLVKSFEIRQVNPIKLLLLKVPCSGKSLRAPIFRSNMLL